MPELNRYAVMGSDGLGSDIAATFSSYAEAKNYALSIARGGAKGIGVWALRDTVEVHTSFAIVAVEQGED